MSDGGYTFHMGMRFVKFMDHVDATAAKLGTTRSRLITAVMLRVLEDDLLETFGAKAEPVVSFRKFYGRVKKVVKHEYVAPELPKHSPIAKKRALELHPMQSRTALSEPLPEMRPRIATVKPHSYRGHYIEKSKTQLRNELREAVLNTAQENIAHE